MLTRRHWLAATAAAACLAAGTARSHAADPNVLWRIVHDRCVLHQAQFGVPLPCTAVDRAGGYAILKDIEGATQFLLIPTARVTGIEDPAILAPGAPNYWQAAWDSINLVLQLRMLAGAVMRLGGTSLVKSSPSRPGGNEGKPGNWVEQQTCEQSMDFRNAEYAGCNQAQAARATGLLSFALLPAACRS